MHIFLFIIVYYGRIAPYRGVVKKSIRICINYLFITFMSLFYKNLENITVIFRLKNPRGRSTLEDMFFERYTRCLWLIYIITKSMRALWLVNQLRFIVPVNSWKNRESSELFKKSNRPQVYMVYRLINNLGCW